MIPKITLVSVSDAKISKDVSEALAKKRLIEAAVEKFEGLCHVPSIKMNVEFIMLGDTEEYSQYRHLESLFIYDTVHIYHESLGLAADLAMMSMTWDCIAECVTKASFGSSQEVTATVASWQISTLSGGKILPGTLTSASLASDTIAERHIQAASVTTNALQAGSVTADKISAGAVTADKISAGAVTAEKISAGTISADKLDATSVKSEYAHITNGSIDNATIATAKVSGLDANYAKIDMGNVSNAWITNGVIKDAAITNSQILSVSANKLTAGTIDASKITVTNLNADNLTVGTINGQRIGKSSIALEKLAEEVPTKAYLDTLQEYLQTQIDGAIETFTSDTVPTLNNYPASGWTDATSKAKHIGDVLYVTNTASSANGYCYRFAKASDGTYSWVLIKDSDVTKALQELVTAQGDISGLKSFQTSTNSWITETDEGLETLRSRTSTIETTYSTKSYAESKAAAAQSTAISTAAADATSKANAAQTAATNAAAADATTKADAAKSAAISTAAADATTKADAAKSAAITTAAADATTKADNAKSAAISTAAADATSKANSALASAKSYADGIVSTKVETTTFKTLKDTVDEQSNTFVERNEAYSHISIRNIHRRSQG